MTDVANPDEATPADPDLEAIRSRLYENIDESEYWSDDILALIAAVEALRQRETQTLGMIADMIEGEMKLSLRAAAAEADLDAERKLKEGYYNEAAKGWKRARAAEARVAKLAGALEELVSIIDGLIEDQVCPHRVDSFTLDPARTALAATPANALERARAVEEVVKAARVIAGQVNYLRPAGELGTALAKLDTLDKEAV